MKQIGGSKAAWGLLEPLFYAAAGILLSCGYAAGVNYNYQMMDSSVGKSPYWAVETAAASINVNGRWGSVSRSFRGKLPSVVLSEVPPPRSRLAQPGEIRKGDYFYLYSDYNSRENHFSPIGYMGDRQNVRLYQNNLDDPAVGGTCIKIVYTPITEHGQGWAGVYWLDPRSNWKGRHGGYNLTGMRRLTFWARGAKGGEQIAVFKVGGIGEGDSETGSATIGPVWLTKEWQQYTIDLRDTDLSQVTGGFAWSSDGSDNIGPLAFYLDNIRYER